MIEKLRKYIEDLEKESMPQLSINCVIMGLHERKLQVIVNQKVIGETKLIVLPGGYIKQSEDLTVSVERTVKESTGLEGILFKQFAVFGKASRSFASEMALKADLSSESDQLVLDWFSKRFISLCYIALVDYQAIELKPTEFFESALWLPLEHAGMLAMDHSDILKSARDFLQKEMLSTPIASNLLPSEFTLPDLLALMESILNRSIDRPNFRRKILSTGMLEKVGIDNSGKRRPADLYRFKHGKNTRFIDDLKFGF